MAGYDTLELRPGAAVLLRPRIGGGYAAAAQCRTLAGAQRLADELNGVRCVHQDVVREAVRLLGLATNAGVAQAAELLRGALPPEEEA